MSNPSGDALLARIKELEEALGDAISYIDECVESCVGDRDEVIERYTKVLNGNQT